MKNKPDYPEGATLKERMKILNDWHKTEDGKASLDRWANKMRIEQQVEERWQAKFYTLSEEEQNAFIEKCLIRYASDSYRDKWFKRGYEPPERMLSELYHYAERYSPRVTPHEVDENDWDGEYHLTDKYTIELILGQGSMVIINNK